MKRYIRDFLSFSFGTWVRAIVSFFTVPITTYLVVPEEFGKAAMFTLVYNIALLFSLLGLDQSFVRHYYESEKRNELFWNCLVPALMIASLISSAFILFGSSLSVLLYGDNYTGIGWLFSVALLTGVFQRFNELSIRMQKKGLLFSGLIVLHSVSNVTAVIIYALLISRDFYSIVFGQIIGNVSAILLGSFADIELRRVSKISLSRIKEHLKFGIPFVPTALLFWLFSSIDRISLRQYSTFTEIGLYSAAFKVVSVMNLIQSGFTTFWVPVVYEKYETSSDPKDFFRKANLAVSCVMFLFGLLILGSKELIFLILNKSYREAAYIAPFLVLYPAMYTISETTVMGINFTKKTYWHIVITGVSAVANFVGNTLLVPHLGARGAAISTGLSYILFFTMRTTIAERLYKIGFESRKVYIGTATIALVAFIGTFTKSFVGTALSSLIAILVILLLYKETALIVYRNLSGFHFRKK